MRNVTREFVGGDRYDYDRHYCHYKKGWGNLVSEQDCSYYGTWVNPEQRKIVSYVEGDLSTVELSTDEEFKEEVRKVINFEREEGYRCSGIINCHNNQDTIDWMVKRELSEYVKSEEIVPSKEAPQ